MSTSNAMQSAVVSATDEAPSPHCTASREQERKDGHAIWRQIATVILKKKIIMSETTRQKFSSWWRSGAFHYFFTFFIVLQLPTMRRVSTACIWEISNEYSSNMDECQLSDQWSLPISEKLFHDSCAPPSHLTLAQPKVHSTRTAFTPSTLTSRFPRSSLVGKGRGMV